MRAVLVCRVAWMDLYEGLRGDEDRPLGGGEYVARHGFGHEVYNFQRDGGLYRGYVQPPGKSGSRLNLERLQGSAPYEHVTGVTVFWVATHPQSGGAR
jgi:hypothetical protein